MAQRYFSLALGGTKNDVTNTSTTTAGAALELRVDETQIDHQDDIIKLFQEVIASVMEQQRYG